MYSNDTCPSCGRPVSSMDAFCPNCGKRLKMSTQCPVCGNELNGAKFCAKCGYNAGNASGGGSQKAKKGGKKVGSFFAKHRKLFIALAAVILIAIIIIPTAVTLASPFRQNKVNKVELGVSTKSDIKKTFGDPTEEYRLNAFSGVDAMKMFSALQFIDKGKDVWVYYDSKIAKKIDKINQKMENAEDFDDLDKLDAELERATKNPYKSIVVAFDDDGKVTFIALNTKTKYDDTDLFATSESKTLKSIDLSQNQVCIDTSIKDCNLTYTAKFSDKSIIKGYLTKTDNAVDTSKQSVQKVTFNNGWGKYSANINVADHDRDENCRCKICGQEHNIDDFCTCIVCGKTFHTVNEWTTESAPTCTEDEIEGGMCISCNNKVTRKGEKALGHNTENGICTRCERIFSSTDFDSKFTSNGYVRTEKSIYYGTYPQSKVTDETLTSALTSLAGNLPIEDNSQAWTSYGYYISGSVSNFMWYIDKEYHGEKYRGVYFTSYRPYYCWNSSSTDDTYQDDNGYYTSTVYWFKYEPIKWRILKESDGKALILADLAIDSQQYYNNYSNRTIDGNTVYANNYAESDIRKWLNDTFYNTAFTSLQKGLIEITNVDNSASSTGESSNKYACSNTYDNIFLLSYKELITYLTSDSERQMESSDYAKSQGVYASSGYGGTCWWWLRSPNYYNSFNVRYVGSYGNFDNFNHVHSTDCGVLPALVIRLA